LEIAMAQGVKKKVLRQSGKAELKPAKLPSGTEAKASLRQVQKFQKGLPSLLKAVPSK
jgi:hypothetical protein